MLRFLSNTHDPKDKYAKMYVARRFDETQEEAWRNHLAWLAGKVIGDPQATEAYTVAQLKEMGMVGVYAQQRVQRIGGNVCPICGTPCGDKPMHVMCDPSAIR